MSLPPVKKKVPGGAAAAEEGEDEAAEEEASPEHDMETSKNRSGSSQAVVLSRIPLRMCI